MLRGCSCSMTEERQAWRERFNQETRAVGKSAKMNRGMMTRRRFLRTTGFGALGGVLSFNVPKWGNAQVSRERQSRVSLIEGDSRADNIFRSLKLIEQDVIKVLPTKKRVLIKPNLVSQTRQLAATHVDCIEAILEFLQPLVRDEIIIGESPAQGSAAKGYSNYGYYGLQKKYNVKFLDLDDESFVITHVIDERYRPQPIRFSRLLLDPNMFVISVAVMKTHDLAVATLSLKNIAVGGPIKDKGFSWAARGSAKSDKPVIHGGPACKGIHYNLFTLAKLAPPDLAVIDGFRGMEGNGPVAGTPVDHRVAIASTDWLSADRIAVELMDFDFNKIGYLWLSTREGLGQGHLSRIEVLGEKVRNHIHRYRPHDNIDSQYDSMKG